MSTRTGLKTANTCDEDVLEHKRAGDDVVAARRDRSLHT